MENYRKIELKGKGSFGQAVLVQSVLNRKFYIMKIIDVTQFDRKQKENALNEVIMLKDLSHHFIIRYRESFVDKSRFLCIVMDYADDGTLEQKITCQKEKRQYFSEQQILDWFTQMCLAIKYIHDKKIIHRDLKTQNIFLNTKGEIKLGDFGIARMIRNSEDLCQTSIGTPYFISPEICQKIPYDQKSDIWSLGCILYEIMSLRHAFDAKRILNRIIALEGLFIKIMRGQIPPIPNHYSEQLKELVVEMLTKEPQKRPNIDDILEKDIIKVQQQILNFIKKQIIKIVNQIKEQQSKKEKNKQHNSCKEKLNKNKNEPAGKQFLSEKKNNENILDMIGLQQNSIADQIEILRIELENDLGLEVFLTIHNYMNNKSVLNLEIEQKIPQIDMSIIKKLEKLIELEEIIF